MLCEGGVSFAYFYPRSPCGERRNTVRMLLRHKQFLSTLSLRRATPMSSETVWLIIVFLSTLSLRRATVVKMSIKFFNADFYPRSPCGERLWQSIQKAVNMPNFYPRSPCGERLCAFVSLFGVFLFLSTLSLRRATVRPTGNQPSTPGISIHALLAESDKYRPNVAPAQAISIHALLAESDLLLAM